MGVDKSTLMYHAKPQIEYVYDLLAGACEEVFLSKRADQAAYQDIPFINDHSEYTGIGPLGGILSAMKAYPAASWLVMACDLPWVDQQTLSYLLKHRDSTKVATAFRSTHDGFPEPLCAVWESKAYSIAQAFLEQGKQCPRKILINSDICLLEQQDPRWLDNVNTMDEYRAIKG